MNIENAKKLVGQLERLPDEKFWMRHYIVHPETFRLFGVRRSKSCGTVACIAGWAVLANKLRAPNGEFSRAKNWLGLTERQAFRLFCNSGPDFAFRTKKGKRRDLSLITRADAIAELKRLIAAEEQR